MEGITVRALCYLGLLACMQGLVGCHEEWPEVQSGPSGWFRVDTWDGGTPAVIDPYVNDGVFDLRWVLEDPSGSLDLWISLGLWTSPSADDITLVNATCTQGWGTCRFDDHQTLQYTTSNVLLKFSADGYLQAIADLTAWRPYGRTLYVHFSACNQQRQCLAGREPVVLW